MDCKRRDAWWLRTRAAVVLALACATVSIAAAAQTPAPATRVVSINLCTDQLLLALAEPRQVLAVSRLARSQLSFQAARAADVRTLAGGAEEVLVLQPDLVLAGAFSGDETRTMLARQSLRVETFVPVTRLAGAREEIGRTAALLGHPERGAALIGEIDNALDAARDAGQGLTAVAYERRGFAAGRGTLTDELMAWMGLVNAAARAGLSSVAAMPLESIIRARPDLLILDWGGSAPPDQGTALLLHPALAHAVAPSRHIVLPAALVTCAGPALPTAISRMAAEVRRIRRERVP